MAAFIIATIATAVALWAAVAIVPGLAARDMGSLLIAAILLGVVNATIRPVAVMLSVPLTILTFGLFLLVVNAAMLALVIALVPGFSATGFWPVLFGALVVSIVAGMIAGAFGAR